MRTGLQKLCSESYILNQYKRNFGRKGVRSHQTHGHSKSAAEGLVSRFFPNYLLAVIKLKLSL